MLPSAHPSPQSKRHIDRFSRSSTAHCRKYLHLKWVLLSPKIAAYDGDSWTPSNTRFTAPTRVFNPNGISIGSAIFAQTTTECLYTLQWDAPPPLKIAFSHVAFGPPSNTWFPGPTRVLNSKGIVFAGLASVTDRLTDVYTAVYTYIRLHGRVRPCRRVHGRVQGGISPTLQWI